MRGKTEKIDKILQKVLLKKGITRNLKLNKIKDIIYSNLSDKDKKHIKVGYLKKNKLILFLNSASLLYEIKCFKKEQLLDKLRKNNEHNIKDIELVLEYKEYEQKR